MLRKLLLDPAVAPNLEDEAALLHAHRDAVLKKRLLRSTFEHFYREAAQAADRHGDAPRSLPEIELGAGSSLFDRQRPWLRLTDVRRAEWLTYLDAQAMALPDASVRAFYGILMFHHLPKPSRFFDELTRTLAPGGVCVLIEPSASALSKAVHSRLHATEFYDPSAGWETPVESAMNGANQALSSIVFSRDRTGFELGWPRLEIVETQPMHNWLRYLASGGVNFRALLPSFSAPFLEGVEGLLSPFAKTLTLHWMVVLRRRP
jgi:SAM-dependent methyltransferase